jgi:hypothetical protein
MATPYAQVLDSIPDIVALLIVVAAFNLVRRQRLSQFADVRILLLLVDALFAGVLIIDLLDRLYSTMSAQFAVVDTLIQSVLILSDVAFLTAISYVIYVRPQEKTFKERVRALITARLWPHGILIFSYTGYLLFSILYLLFGASYSINSLTTVGGVKVTGLEYNQGTEIVSVVILGIFFAYPSVEMFMAARRMRNRFVGRNIQALGMSWIVIGVELFIFNGYLVNHGIDLREIGYLVSAAAFSVSLVIFRRVSVLEEFFATAKKEQSVRVSSSSSFSSTAPFSSRIVAMPAVASAGAHSSSIAGMPSGREDGVEQEKEMKICSRLIKENAALLLEVDPISKYEEMVRDLAIESSSIGYSVFAFTANGSPRHRILSALPQVRMYVMSSDISYPRPASNQPRTMLVPVYDGAIMLDIFDTLSRNSTPEAKSVVIFDNLSDLVLTAGFENSFKFLKKTIEVLNDSNVSIFFLLISETLEARSLNIIRSLFGRHLAFDLSGLEITR